MIKVTIEDEETGAIIDTFKYKRVAISEHREVRSVENADGTIAELIPGETSCTISLCNQE